MIDATTEQQRVIKIITLMGEGNRLRTTKFFMENSAFKSLLVILEPRAALVEIYKL